MLPKRKLMAFAVEGGRFNKVKLEDILRGPCISNYTKYSKMSIHLSHIILRGIVLMLVLLKPYG